ncbi:MAG TPA: hypothetical protein VHP33_00590 [Polyangiaceae bacterium]|nr:hypothetical protein [Polyangiaceae bacterium]
MTSLPAPVVVEIYAPQPRPQELAVLLAACSRAATPHECVSSENKASEPPLGIAIVRRDGDHARIELGLRALAAAQWTTRDLQFQPGDDELERYRAMGFAIGTLVAREVEPPPAEPPAAPAPSAPVTAPTPPPPAEVKEPAAAPAPRPRRATWVDVSGSVGLGLIPGPPRAGGSLRAAFEVIPRGLFGVAETAYAERGMDSQLRVRWLNAALGVGHPLAPNLRTVGIDVRLLVVLERMTLTAERASTEDAASRWKPGVSVAIDGHWDFASPVGLVVSAAAFIDPERTVVHIEGDLVGETPALGLNGFVGLRFKLR